MRLEKLFFFNFFDLTEVFHFVFSVLLAFLCSISYFQDMFKGSLKVKHSVTILFAVV